MSNLLWSQNDGSEFYAFPFSVAHRLELLSFVQGYNPAVAIPAVLFVFPQTRVRSDLHCFLLILTDLIKINQKPSLATWPCPSHPHHLLCIST